MIVTFKPVKPLLAALVFSVVAACSDTNPTQSTEASPNATTNTIKVETTDSEAAEAMTPVKVKAVLVYADWCGSCKVLDPKINAVRAAHPLEGMEFVVLDYTDKNPENFYAQATTTGVSDVIKGAMGESVKTGQLFLIDVDDNLIMSTVVKSMEEPEILQAMQTALNDA